MLCPNQSIKFEWSQEPVICWVMHVFPKAYGSGVCLCVCFSQRSQFLHFTSWACLWTPRNHLRNLLKRKILGRPLDTLCSLDGCKLRVISFIWQFTICCIRDFVFTLSVHSIIWFELSDGHQWLFNFIFPELDMALAYWNIVLKDRFRFIDLWCKFLTVGIQCLCCAFKPRHLAGPLLHLGTCDHTAPCELRIPMSLTSIKS